MTATDPATTLPRSQAPALRDRPYVFHMVPQLRELLPKQHGRPGLIYAQVAVVNMRRAQDQGWSEVDGTVVYTIKGPKGDVDAKLMAKGIPLRGLSHASGKRRCVVDKLIRESTGHVARSKPLDIAKEPTNGQPVPQPQAAQVKHGSAQRPSGSQ